MSGGMTDTGRRVLITGGSGLIGRAVTAELAAASYQVVVLSRRPERVRDLPEGARAEGWDGRSSEGWSRLADGAAGIVHLAGENIAGGRWTAARKRRLCASRVESSRAVAAAVASAAIKPGFLLQGSAVGYYGDGGDRVIGEEHPPADDFLGRLCVEWEEASAAVEELGVRRAVLRTGIVLAREGGALLKMALPFRLFAGGPLGSGRQYLPWIHLADVAAAIRFLAEREDAHGPFNLTAPDPVTNEEFSRTLARVLRRPNLFRVPAVALHVALGELAGAMLEGQRAVPRALVRLGFSFRFPRLEPALRDLLG